MTLQLTLQFLFPTSSCFFRRLNEVILGPSVTEEQLNELAHLIGADWPKLAGKLHHNQNQIKDLTKKQVVNRKDFFVFYY